MFPYGGDRPVAAAVVKDALGFRCVRAEPVTVASETVLDLPEEFLDP